MKIRLLLIAAVVLPISAFAQTVAAPIRPAPRTEAVPIVAPVQQDVTVDPAVVDPQGTIDRLEADNRRLRAENDRQQADIVDLEARLAAMTSRDGSAVRAYCEAPNLSRNTAGAEENCGNFRCNQVSGLCHASCTTTDHCSTGICDPVSHTCVPN